MCFRELRTAREHSGAAILSVELELRTPVGEKLVRMGSVPSLDNRLSGRDSPRQDDGVLPEFGAVVIDRVVWDKEEPEATEVDEIVFRNPRGGQFVLM